MGVINENYELFLYKLYKKLKTEYTDDYTSVHFSRINKVGLNPNPTHHDPIGVYSFPRDYVLHDINNNMFANMPYAHILVPTKKAVILDLASIQQDDAEYLLEDMGIPIEYLTDYDTYHNSGNAWGHMLWGAMERYRNENNLSKNVSWNVLFKRTGYNALYDSGEKIIHTAEPSQIVYLEAGTYKVLDSLKKATDGNIFGQFIKAFSDWKPTKRKSSGEVALTLKKGKTEMSISRFTESYFSLQVNIYGRSSNNEGGQFMRRYESGDTFNDILSDVNKFLDSTTETEQNEADSEFSIGATRGHKFIEYFGKYFKLRTNPKNKSELTRKYKEKDGSGEIKFRIYSHGRYVNAYLERRIPYSSYNYYYYTKDIETMFKGEDSFRDPKQVALELLKDIQLQIIKNSESDDYDEQTKGLRAMDAFKFIKRNVLKL